MNPAAGAARLVFITGASGGIGQALALRYARAGWRLALLARRGDEIERWAREQGLASERFAVYAADVRDIAALATAARACIAQQGLPDVVIANAGISIGVDGADAADLEVLRAILETNVLGLAATFQPFIAPMRERRSGTLVGMASVGAIRGLPGHGGYGASKAAVVNYCESLRAECRPQGVRVVTIAPGYVATALTSRNPYAMPFLLSAEDFADRAYRVIGRGVRYRIIPWQMAIVGGALRLMPGALFDRLFKSRPRKRRQGQ